MRPTDDENEETEKTKHVHFEANVEEPLHHSMQQERDITIYSSFLIVKWVVRLLFFNIYVDISAIVRIL